MAKLDITLRDVIQEIPPKFKINGGATKGGE